MQEDETGTPDIDVNAYMQAHMTFVYQKVGAQYEFWEIRLLKTRFELFFGKMNTCSFTRLALGNGFKKYAGGEFRGCYFGQT